MDIFPSSLTLPGGSEQSQFVLVSIPRATGEITVQGKWVWSSTILSPRGHLKVGVSFLTPGYEATVFGVHHKCDMKIAGNPIIRVISKLPQLGVRSFPVLSPEGGGGAVEEGVAGRRTSKSGIEKFDLMDGER